MVNNLISNPERENKLNQEESMMANIQQMANKSTDLENSERMTNTQVL